MNDYQVTGIIIKSEPIGDYDRRLVLLTKEKGKISAFAKGALRPTNRFMGCVDPFIFGIFSLYAGSSSYSLTKVEVKNYFEGFRKDLNATFYGTYFLEIADYFGHENTDNVRLMRLLYRALTLLLDDSVSNDFVKTVYEMKAVMLEGLFPIPDENEDFPEGGRRAIRYVYEARAEDAFSFKVSDETFAELKKKTDSVCKNTFDKEFKSLSMIAFAEENT